ncbi:hypothetical protein GJJ64_05510 [Pedobacter sp. HX-22-1]|uniref:RHS repeat protein n=2 Tax=Pedobacter puniceum TaxID=2666136 RepID=A0A7K0FNN9_9SPHI|nr:hypothetical protein [Pedobacter puniceum]
MLGACKKSDDAKEEVCTTVSSYSEAYDNSTNTYTLTYDSQNRITNQASSDGSFTRSFTYNASIITEVTNENGFIYNYTYSLDGNNRIVKEQSGSEVIATYKYDNNGYLSEIGRNGQIISLKWENGNLVEKDNGNGKTTYTYYEDTAPTSHLVVIGEFVSESGALYNYFGKTPKNLLKEKSGNVYTYEKDNQGRVTKVTVTSGDYKDIFSLNYSCQ